MGYNKLLFKRLFMGDGAPDCFLTVAGSELTGRLPVGTEGWRSNDTWLLPSANPLNNKKPCC